MEDAKKRLSILPALIISNKKIGNEKIAQEMVKELKYLSEENEPESKEYIIANYYSYETMKFLGMDSDAANYLENAYFEMKSKSKNIKNKSDRNTYLNTIIHKKITNAWANK